MNHEPELLLVATLVVRRSHLAEFREFEGHAARIMARYDGSIREAVFIDADPNAPTVKEVHVVSFPDRAAFDAYRADAELQSLAPLREQAIVATSVELGERAPHD